MENKEISYQHYKNKKYYKIVGKCMIQVNDIWKDAIIYKWEFGEQLYARSESEFFEKFKLKG